jgi:integrase
MIFPGDQPPRTGLLPRALAGNVMAQVEQPGNLARETNPAYRLVTIILIRCGLRVSDALKLPFDCVTADDAGAPYLRYFNHKMKREALVPLDELLALISGQQQRVLDRYLSGTVLFPRPEKNPDGKTPVSSGTYRQALYRWLERCDVRDEHGQPVHLTPHQWRHTRDETAPRRRRHHRHRALARTRRRPVNSGLPARRHDHQRTSHRTHRARRRQTRPLQALRQAPRIPREPVTPATSGYPGLVSMTSLAQPAVPCSPRHNRGPGISRFMRDPA